ncbi:MAG: element excision factor XisI family protein [Candidatus Odinarchaeota archaeon]
MASNDSSEEGIATEFENRGVPKSQIILGWIPPSQRKYTDYAST